MALTISVSDIVQASRSPLLAIRNHWSRVRIGDIGEVLNGAPFKSELFSRDTGVPLIRIRDVGSGETNTKYTGEFDQRFLINAGDLLVGMDGDFNCARWRGAPALLNQRVCKLSVDPRVYEPRLLDYVLPAYLLAINRTTSSVTVKHLSSRSIEDIPLPFPPLSEQRSIVAELDKQFSRLDEAIASLQRALRNIGIYRQSILNEVFPATDGLVAVSVSDVCSVISGFAFKSEDFTTEGIPVVKIANVGYGEFACKNQQYLPTQFLARHIGFVVEPNDILIALTRPITEDTLKVCQYPEGVPKALLNQRVAILRPLEAADGAYLLAQLHSPQVKSQVLAALSQTLQPNLSPSDLRRVSLHWPSKRMRNDVVAECDRRLSITRGVEAQVDANLKRAQALRQAVLAKAFGGPEGADAPT